MSIDTSRVAKPAGFSTARVNRELIATPQLLAPHLWKELVQNLGPQNFTTWLSTFSTMEEVKGQDFFHFEDKGALMGSIRNNTAVTTPAAGATVTVALSTEDHFDSGTKSQIRVGETVVVCSSGVEGKVISINQTTPGAHTMTVRPLKSTVAFAGNTGSLIVGEIIKLASNTEAGEASGKIASVARQYEKIENYCTQIREDWTASDLAEMEETWFDYKPDGGFMSAGIERGMQGAYTYAGLAKTNMMFLNNVDQKLTFGGLQDNTGLNPGTKGTKGWVPEVLARGNGVTYTLGALNLAKMQEITAQMLVYGNPRQNQWIMDIQQRQEIDNSLFNTFQNGSFIYGNGSASEQASVAYGFQNIMIDNFVLQLGMNPAFTTEITHKRTPNVDKYRNFGIIIPQNQVNTKYYNGGVVNHGKLKSLQVMYQQPFGEGTIANGVRVFTYGGGAKANLTERIENNVSMITYKGMRTAGIKQFIAVTGS